MASEGEKKVQSQAAPKGFADKLESAELLQELRDTAERFRAAQELALHGFAIFRAVRNSAGKIVDFEWVYRNPVAEQLAPLPGGYEGVRLLAVMPAVRETGVFEKYVSVVESGNSVEFDTHNIRDGREFWFRIAATRLQDGVAVSYNDISNLRRAEQERSTLIEAGARFSSSLDLHSTVRRVVEAPIPHHAEFCFVQVKIAGQRIRCAAAASETHHHVANMFETVGHDWRALEQLLGPEGATHVTENWSPELARNVFGPELAKEVEAVRWRSSVAVALRRGDEVIGCFVIASTLRRYDSHDFDFIEELARRSGAALENAKLYAIAQEERERAEEANRIKDEFLATVSHELRTPLNAILGWATILLREKPSHPRISKASEAIARNAQAQAKLVDDILDVSRIISGKLKLDPRPIDLAQIVHESLDVVRPSATAKSIELELITSQDGAVVMGDGQRLQQVVWNLLSNAVKFTDERGKIALRLDRHGGLVTLEVKDSGRGIAPEFLPFVFERFRQADASTTRRFGGLGLGLAIVRHIVELHGGYVQAESAGIGRGATFRLAIPAYQGAAPSFEPRRTSGMWAPPPRLEGVRILVVDDELENRELMRESLAISGADVMLATSVEEALQRMTTFRPDVVVSDIGMPDRDGYDFIRELRSAPETRMLPALALTAHARAEDRIRAMRAGYNLHVPKPIEPLELCTAIASVLGNRKPPAT